LNIYTLMPNKRASGQKGVIVMMKEEFISDIDSAIGTAGYSDRSSFIREAVYEKLRALGLDVPPASKAARSRVGVGGRPAAKKKHSAVKKPTK